MSANETSTVDPARTFLRWHLLGGRPIIELAEDAARVFAENPGELFRTSELLAIAELIERLSLSGDTVPDPQTIFSRRKRLEELLTPKSFFYGLPGQHSNFTDFRLYVPVPVRAMEPGKLRQNAQRPRSRYAELTELLQDLDNNRIDHGILLFGESGAGKTVATIKATHDCFFADVALEQVSAPLAGFLPCRIKTDMDLLPANDTLEHLLIATSRLPHTDANVNRVREYLRWSKLLVLCDLNSVTKNREQVVDALRSLQQRVKDQKSNGYPQHRVVITYRSTRQDDGLLTRLMKDGLFQKYEMEPLNAVQASGYIQNLGNVEASICDNLGISAPIRNITVDVQLLRNLSGRFTPNGKPLISIPLLMHFVSILPESQRNAVQHTADLYDSVVEQLLQRNEHLYPERLPEPLLGEEGRTVLRALMTRIALSILSQSADAVLLTRDQCRKILARPDQYAEQQRLWPHSDSDDDAWWQPENSRYYSNFDPLPAERVVWPRELLNAVMEFGLLRREGNQIGFLHDSFLYYFAGAIALWDRGIPELDAGPASKIDAWADAVAARIQTDPETWRLPCEFLSGRLSARTAREIVERLIVADPLPGLTRLIQTLTQLHRSASSTSTGAESGVAASGSSWPDAKILHIIDWTTRRHGSWLHANPQQLMHSCVYDLQWWNADRESELRRYVDNRLRSRLERCDRDWPECLHGGRVPRIMTMSEHTKEVTCTAAFRDSSGVSWVVSGSADGTVKVWNPETGSVSTMREHDSRVTSVMVVERPTDWPLVVSGSQDNTVKAWAWEPNRDPHPSNVRTMRQHEGWVTSVAVIELLDGRRLIVSGSEDRTVKAWMWKPDHDPQPGEVRTMRHHTNWVSSVAVVEEPNGRLLIVSASRDGTVKAWMWKPDHDPESGDVCTMSEHRDYVSCLTVAQRPDGSPLIVSGSEDGTVKAWSFNLDRNMHPMDICTMMEHGVGVRCIAVAEGQDGGPLIVSGDWNGAVKVWDWKPNHAPQPGSVRTMKEHSLCVLSVAVIDGSESQPLVASGGRDGTVRVWALDSGHGAQIGAVRAMYEHAGDVNGVAFLTRQDGTPLVISGSDDRTVKAWAWAPDHSLQLDDVSNIRKRQRRICGMAILTGVNGREQLLTGGWDHGRWQNAVHAWAWESNPHPQPCDVSTMGQHNFAFKGEAVVVSPEGRPMMLCRSWDTSVDVWWWDPSHAEWALSIAVAEGPYDRPLIVSGGSDGTVKVWEWGPHQVPQPGIVRTMREHTEEIHSVAVMERPDNRPLIISGGGCGTVKVWEWDRDRDPQPGNVRTMREHDHYVTGVAGVVGSDGRPLIVSCGWDGTVKVWQWDRDHDPQPGDVRTMLEHERIVNGVAVVVGPNGRPVIVSGGDDGKVIVWQPQFPTTTEQTAPGHPLVLIVDSAVTCVATSPNSASSNPKPPDDPNPWFAAGLNDGRVVIVQVHCRKSE